MWRSSKALLVNCVQSLLRCGRNNLESDELEDISEYDMQDVPGHFIAPVHFQPQTFGIPIQVRREDLQHRPDAPGVRRCSPPEVVTRMRQALEEMSEMRKSSVVRKALGDHYSFSYETCLSSAELPVENN